MKTKPSRTFENYALLLAFVLLMGLIALGVLLSPNQRLLGDNFTRPAAQATNTAIVTQSNNQANGDYIIFTAIPYTADMSPTAAVITITMNSATMTAIQQQREREIQGTSTQLALSITPYRTRIPPYEPTLYAERQVYLMGLITGAGPTEYAIFYQTEQALIAAYQTAQYFTPTPSPTLTVTVSSTAGIQNAGCSYAWAHRAFPDVAALAETAFIKAEITNTTIRVDAYGEDCFDNNTNQVVGFSAMTTDFYLTVQVDADKLEDQTALYNDLMKAYAALNTIPLDKMPALPGYLDINWLSGGEYKRFHAMFGQIQAALDKGLSDEKFLEELGGIQ
jgi:hypothetical protein